MCNELLLCNAISLQLHFGLGEILQLEKEPIIQEEILSDATVVQNSFEYNVILAVFELLCMKLVIVSVVVEI